MSQKKKKGIPDRWLDYCPVGQRIPGTRFIAFKVPLKPSLNCNVPGSHAFGLWDLMHAVERQKQELGLIIDLTFTTKYYTVTDVPKSCSYIKIFIEGHRVPSNEAILSFKRAVRQFLKENQKNNKLIGVHCTHGLNRTGYLICRYLIDVDGLDPAAALELFNTSRGHCIERKNYLHDLNNVAKRSNEGIDKPDKKPVMGLAVDKSPLTAIKQGEKAETTTTAQDVQASGDDSAENQQPNEKQPQQKQTKRRGRRRPKKDAERSNEGIDKPDKKPIMGLAVDKSPPMAIKQGEKAETTTTAQDVQASGDDPAENQQPNEKQPLQKQTKRRGRRCPKKEKKSADRSAQGGLPTACKE